MNVYVTTAKSKVNTGWDLGIKSLPAIFQHELLWQNDLVLGETLWTLKPKNTNY